MLPILRIIPVGGVSLAILLLILALGPPGDSHAALPAAMTPARGALIARTEHPEWRQFLIQAALRRAEALDALRQLPDTPTVAAIPQPQNPKPEKAEPPVDIAGVPAKQDDAQPEDVTGSIVQSPDQAIPIDIGETSSTELPVMPQEERPPVIMMPERRRPPEQGLNVAPEPAKPAIDSGNSTRGATHRAALTEKPPEPVQFNLLQALFGGAKTGQSAAKSRR